MDQEHQKDNPTTMLALASGEYRPGHPPSLSSSQKPRNRNKKERKETKFGLGVSSGSRFEYHHPQPPPTTEDSDDDEKGRDNSTVPGAVRVGGDDTNDDENDTLRVGFDQHEQGGRNVANTLVEAELAPDVNELIARALEEKQNNTAVAAAIIQSQPEEDELDNNRDSSSMMTWKQRCCLPTLVVIALFIVVILVAIGTLYNRNESSPSNNNGETKEPEPSISSPPTIEVTLPPTMESDDSPTPLPNSTKVPTQLLPTTNTPTLPPIPTREETIVNILAPYFDVTSFPESSSSIQREALDWLLYEDPASLSQTEDPIVVLHRYVLVLFYLDTHGSEWYDNNHWLTAFSYCDWTGVNCNGIQQVMDLNLHVNNIQGTLSSELALLTRLTSLGMESNKITGISSYLGRLTNLEELLVADQFIQGTLPTEIGMMRKLDYFDVNWNQLSGSIPTEIGELTELSFLDLGGNELTGTIPSEIGLLTKLVTLRLYDNRLTGTVPSTISSQLTNLEFVYLGSNQLEDCIPAFCT